MYVFQVEKYWKVGRCAPLNSNLNILHLYLILSLESWLPFYNLNTKISNSYFQLDFIGAES